MSLESKTERTVVATPVELGSTQSIDSSQLSEAEKSLQHTRFEHSLKFWEACRLYRPAVLWSLFINLAVILSGYDGALIGSLAGLSPFTHTYGHKLPDGTWAVPPQWLSAFNYAAMVGGLPGNLMGGIAYDRYGPRRTLVLASIGSIASIFIQFFSVGPEVLFVGELLNGFVIGFYPVIANAYVSEVTPVAARGVTTGVVNLSFGLGQLFASGILKGTSGITTKWSYKIPFATQWVVPIFILALLFWCPSPPYWLCKRGRIDDARKTLKRFTTSGVDIECQLANILETLRQEESSEEKTSILECFRGTNLRRTIISCQVYNIQAICGNILFINYAVVFFEIAGLSSSDAFSLNIGLTCMSVSGTLLSYILMTYMGRRIMYLWGSVIVGVFVLMIGILGAVPSGSSGPMWAMCSIMAVTNLVYNLTLGPCCFAIMSEVSVVKLRGTTIALSNITVTILSIVSAVGIPYALDTTGANWGGKLGFLFAGLGVLNWAWCFFYLPEMKGRTFEELDFMFQHKVPTREFKAYQIEGIHVLGEVDNKAVV